MPSRRGTRAREPFGLAAVAAVALAAALLACVKDFDSDLFWHLKAGERILEQRRVEKQDEFSWTAAGETFVNHEWLADIGLALVHRRGGFPLVVATKAVLIGLAFVAIA